MGTAVTIARRAALVWCAGVAGLASAQTVPSGLGDFDRGMGPPERSMAEWLVRLQRAARVRSYVGTFVVSSAAGAMSSSRIWHFCEGDLQMERIEALSGVPRTIFRRNDVVMTFLPESRTVRAERREAGGVFPNLLAPGEHFATADFYSVREEGRGRVAGFDADVVHLHPRDNLRFGYRLWSEQQTGLVVKTQTLDAAGRVLEQSAFSELQFDAPMQASKLQQLMASTEGYRVERPERTLTSADAEGWRLASSVPGFQSQGCYRHSAVGQPSVVQWIFSDGLATVSLFLEPFDAQRHQREGVAAMGATHTLSRRIAQGADDWWLTAVGEVPARTLRTFADRVERRN